MEARCRKCGNTLRTTYTDTSEGTLWESIEQCDNCGLVYHYHMGHYYEEDQEGENMIGMYDHLDRDEKYQFTMNLSMTQVIEKIMLMNYGQHRLLSELVRQRKASRNAETTEYRQHTDMLEQLLNEGFY